MEKPAAFKVAGILCEGPGCPVSSQGKFCVPEFLPRVFHVNADFDS